MDTRARDVEGRKWRSLWGKPFGRTRKLSASISIAHTEPEKPRIAQPAAAPRQLPLRPRRGPPQSQAEQDASLSSSEPSPPRSRLKSDATTTASFSGSRKTIENLDPEWDELQPAIPVHAGERVDTRWSEAATGSTPVAGTPAPFALSLPSLPLPPVPLVHDIHPEGTPPEGQDASRAETRAASRAECRSSRLEARAPSRTEGRPSSRSHEARPPSRTEVRASSRTGMRPSSRSNEARPPSRTDIQASSRTDVRPSSRAEVRVSSRTETRAIARADGTSVKEVGWGFARRELPKGEARTASLKDSSESARGARGGIVPERYSIRTEALPERPAIHVGPVPKHSTARADIDLAQKMEDLASLKNKTDHSHHFVRSEGAEKEMIRSRPSSRASSRAESIDTPSQTILVGKDASRVIKDKERWGDVPWPRVDSSTEREREECRHPRERRNPPASLSSGAARASVIMASPPELRGRRSSGPSHSHRGPDERSSARWVRSLSVGTGSSPCVVGPTERKRTGSNASSQLATAAIGAERSPANRSTGSTATTSGSEDSSIPSKRQADRATAPASFIAGDPPCLRPAAVAPTHFQRIRLLGQGDVGRVYLVRDKYTATLFAMKVLNKKELVRRDKVRRALMEQQILLRTRHPFVIRLHHTFQSNDFLFLCLDYACGGELFSALRRHDPPVLSERMARFYAAEVVLALGYLHTRGVVYRDLKPENLLLTREGHLLLSDFDLSARAPNGDLTGFRTNSLVGTVVYLAPEVIRGEGHTAAVDWWSLGILIYEMVHAMVPFQGDTQDDTFDLILQADLEFLAPPRMGRRGTAFVRELLAKDEKSRLGAKGVQSVQAHPWFTAVEWDLLPHCEPPLHPEVPEEAEPEQLMGRSDRPAVREDRPSAKDPFAAFESVSTNA